jgi:hypothetical protein
MIVTSIVDTTDLSFVNATVACLLDPSQRIEEHWGCLEEPNGGGGLHTHNVTPIIDNNYAA